MGPEGSLWVTTGQKIRCPLRLLPYNQRKEPPDGAWKAQNCMMDRRAEPTPTPRHRHETLLKQSWLSAAARKRDPVECRIQLSWRGLRFHSARISILPPNPGESRLNCADVGQLDQVAPWPHIRTTWEAFIDRRVPPWPMETPGGRVQASVFLRSSLADGNVRSRWEATWPACHSLPSPPSCPVTWKFSGWSLGCEVCLEESDKDLEY